MEIYEVKKIAAVKICEIADKRQESCSSDGAVKITQKKRYQLGIENILLMGLIFHHIS